MEFIELTEKEFSKYEEKHIYGNFYQTIKWGELKRKNGWEPFYVGLKDNETIVAGALLLRKKVISNLSIIYSPRGFLLDYKNLDILSEFTKYIKKFAKKQKAFFVKIDPYVIHKERDKFGKIVSNGIDNEIMISNLKKLGYKHFGFKLEGNLQPQYAFALNLKDKSIDDIFNNMESVTKSRIRKVEKNGSTTRFINVDELDKFTDIMADTSIRRGFIDRPYTYYKNMMEIFGDELKIMISEINLDECINTLSISLESTQKLVNDCKDKLSKKDGNEKKISNQLKEAEILLNSLTKKMNTSVKLRDEKGSNLVLGGLLFLLHNKEILSLFGGAYGEYRDYMAAYLMNWEMIKYAKENEYEKYNFYGISNYTDPNNEMYGLYDFKRGFDGQIEEYLGEFDLVISKFWYFMYTKVYNIYVKLKSKKTKK